MIIGICGPKGSGKSTLAELLFEHYKFERIAFADGLKAMLQALYEYQGYRNGRTRRMLWGDLKEDPITLLNGQSSRHAMQTLGTEWGRECIHPDLWVDVWERRIRGRERVVTEDIRFPNEAERVWTLGGQVVMLDRPIEEDDDSPPDLHSSERQFLSISPDLYLINDGTPEQMLERVVEQQWFPALAQNPV